MVPSSPANSQLEGYLARRRSCQVTLHLYPVPLIEEQCVWRQGRHVQSEDVENSLDESPGPWNIILHLEPSPSRIKEWEVHPGLEVHPERDLISHFTLVECKRLYWREFGKLTGRENIPGPQ